MKLKIARININISVTEMRSRIVFLSMYKKTKAGTLPVNPKITAPHRKRSGVPIIP